MADEISTSGFDPKHWVWGADASKPRVLHTMIRVKDFEAALRFYVDGLGMKVLYRFEIEARRVSACFIGFEDYDVGGVLELTHLWDIDEYTHGSGYGHVAIGVPDLLGTLARLEAMGVEVTTRPIKYFADAPHIAFVKDLDGYAVELIQTRRELERSLS